MLPVRTLLVAAALLAAGTGSGSAVQVNLKQGVFKGEIIDAGDGRQVYSFRGIPYAKPPVGKLRFKVSNDCISFCKEFRSLRVCDVTMTSHLMEI